MAKNERELGALIIRNIGDIEAALNHVHDHIDEKLLEAINLTTSSSLSDEGWYVEPIENLKGTGWFAPATWCTEIEGERDSKLWFQVRAYPSFEAETWLATITGNTPDGECLAITVEQNLYVRDWKPIIADAEISNALRQLGFMIDGNRVYLPLKVNADSLADAFVEDSLAEGFGDLSRVLKVLAGSIATLAVLHERVCRALT